MGIAIAFAAAWFGLPKDRAGSTIDQILVATRAACGVNQRPLAKAGEAFSFVEQTRCPKAQREESGIEISIVPQHFNYSFLSAACPAPTKTAGMNVVCAINNHNFFLPVLPCVYVDITSSRFALIRAYLPDLDETEHEKLLLKWVPAENSEKKHLQTQLLRFQLITCVTSFPTWGMNKMQKSLKI